MRLGEPLYAVYLRRYDSWTLAVQVAARTFVVERYLGRPPVPCAGWYPVDATELGHTVVYINVDPVLLNQD